MFFRTPALLAAAVATTASVAWAASNDGCQELTDPTLCGSPSSVIVPPDVCASGDFVFEPMPPCCRVQSESKPCQNPPPESGSVCRSVEIGAASCPPDDNSFCSIEAMKLKLSLSFQHSNRTCCDKCTCYGDPHCEAFDGTPDTWVICDARNANPGKKHCPMDPDICATQTDHLGRTCKWQTNGNGASWVVAIQGSPCIPSTWNPPPMMLMYQADDFKAELTMGERSIITNIIISDGGNQYVLEASHCFTDAAVRNPWRVNVGDRDPPSDIPDWLPDTWVWSPMDGGDILWSVFGLESNIDLTIRCTRTVERRGARTVYSQPRLNIEQLIEPMNWRGDDPNAIARTNVDGFCATGEINTQGSTDVTERIERLGLCQLTSDELDVAKLLCSPGTTRPGITACKFNWCKSVRTDWESCYNEVQTTGWATAWCAAHTTVSKQSKDCAANANCKRCQTDIGDFGWVQGIKEWSDTQVSEGDCVTRDDLPLDLVDCQSGVRIQFEAAPDQWVTYVAVPSTVVLCNGGLEFDSQADAPLFSNRVRVQQCSMPHGCLSDKCMSEVGFSASFQYESVKNEEAQIVDLYQAGVLVCDPVLYPNDPTGCLTVQPPAMCPCPGSDGGGGGGARRALRAGMGGGAKKGSAARS